MSDKPSEYLKRTCLICGCHTNQTINIYEPRSGPNIVQLIQAKFKFQPLNEDKYLCFSCNNWLINWHSLQVLNSNDGESPSGTFRPHMNGMVQEEHAKPSHHQQQPQQQHPNKAHVRPVAKVRPLQLNEATVVAVVTENSASRSDSNKSLADTKPCHRTLRYSKRSFRAQAARWRRCVPHKSVQTCRTCGHSVVVRMRATLNATALRLKRKCRKCCAWPLYLRRVTKVLRREQSAAHRSHNLVNTLLDSSSHIASNHTENNQSLQRLQRPLVDGKVVAMLRRLGTTLSRENASSGGGSGAASAILPPIMSPAKPKPRWTRQLDEDEILLDFNTAISEVLPQALTTQRSREEVTVCQPKQTRRRLTYQMSVETTAELRAEKAIYAAIPKGLSVTLI